MNLSEITCIALGMILNVLTFFLGVAVGVSVVKKKKELNHGNRYENEGFRYYPKDPEDDATGGSGRRK
jgi:pectate lyase